MPAIASGGMFVIIGASIPAIASGGMFVIIGASIPAIASGGIASIIEASMPAIASGGNADMSSGVADARLTGSRPLISPAAIAPGSIGPLGPIIVIFFPPSFYKTADIGLALSYRPPYLRHLLFIFDIQRKASLSILCLSLQSPFQ
jgi:hypothetical protein